MWQMAHLFAPQFSWALNIKLSTGTVPTFTLHSACVSRDDSDQGNDAGFAHALPGQPEHQGVELGALQAAVAALLRRPYELSLMQPARRQPDADAIVHEYLDTVGALVGKEIGGVRVGRAEDCHHAGKCGIGGGADSVEMMVWLAMRGALSRHPGTLRRIQRHYWAPLLTGYGLLAFEAMMA